MRRFDIERGKFQGSEQVTVKAGVPKRRRIVPPAGPEHAFDVEDWPRRVTVYVSPTGRSVRVWVDGVEIPKPVADAA